MSRKTFVNDPNGCDAEMEKTFDFRADAPAEKAMCDACCRKGIFTLIELLVVIAIIAILLRSKWLFFCCFLLILRFRVLMRKRLTLKYRM